MLKSFVFCYKGMYIKGVIEIMTCHWTVVCIKCSDWTPVFIIFALIGCLLNCSVIGQLSSLQTAAASSSFCCLCCCAVIGRSF